MGFLRRCKEHDVPNHNWQTSYINKRSICPAHIGMGVSCGTWCDNLVVLSCLIGNVTQSNFLTMDKNMQLVYVWLAGHFDSKSHPTYMIMWEGARETVFLPRHHGNLGGQRPFWQGSSHNGPGQKHMQQTVPSLCAHVWVEYKADTHFSRGLHNIWNTCDNNVEDCNNEMTGHI